MWDWKVQKRNPTIAKKKKKSIKRLRWAWIEHATFRSSVWRSPNWAIPATCQKRPKCFTSQWILATNSIWSVFFFSTKPFTTLQVSTDRQPFSLKIFTFKKSWAGESVSVKNAEVPIKSSDRVQCLGPTHSLVHGILGTVQRSQGQRVQPCLSNPSQTQNRRPPSPNHRHFRQRSRRGLRRHIHTGPDHKDYDSR